MKLLCQVCFVILLWQSEVSAQSPCQQSILIDIINFQNQRIGGLLTEDLESPKNQQLSILSIEKVSLTPRVLVLWDISGSMGDRATPYGTRFAILDLLQSFPANISVALMVFSREPKLLTDFSLDRAAALQAVESVYRYKMAGQTAIFLSVDKAIDVFGSRPVPGDAIILVSDGENDSGPDLQGKLSRRLKHAQVRLFGHLWKTDEPRPFEDDDPTLNLIRKSGGSFLWNDAENLKSLAKNDDKLKSALAKIAVYDREIIARILFPYRLTVARGFPQDWARLKLKLAPKRSFNGNRVILTYQDELPPCTN